MLLAVYILFGFAQASGEYRVLFLQSQGLNATQCGYVLAGASLLAAFARPLTGALADKLRSRRVVFLGSVTGWMTLLVLLLAVGQVRLASLSLCVGIIPFLSVGEQVTYGMIEAAGVTAALRHKRLDFSLIRVCLSMGYCGINFLYTPLVERFGPLAPFACTVVYLAALLLLSGSLRSFETLPGGGVNKAAPRKKLEIGRLFRNYYLVTFVLLFLLMSLGTQTSSFVYYLLDELELDTSLVGMAAGIRVLGEVLIMPLVPRLKRMLSLPMLQAVAGTLCILQMVLYLTCKNPYVILCVIMLSGMASGITLSTTAVYLRLMAPEGLDTTTLSLSTAVSSLSQVIVSLVGGRVVDSLGIFALYRIVLSCLCLWIVLYFSSWAFGKYGLKKTPPVPMFQSKAPRDCAVS